MIATNKPTRRITAKHVAGAGAIAAAIAIATPFVSSHEGERLVAYRDAVGIPTACDGETRGIRMGMRFSHEQCKKMLEGRLEEFAQGVYSCVTVDMSASRAAAMISFAYNIGIGGFCRSSIVRLLNEGRGKEACDHLLAYDRAGGRVLVGLERRREAERKLCEM